MNQSQNMQQGQKVFHSQILQPSQNLSDPNFLDPRLSDKGLFSGLAKKPKRVGLKLTGEKEFNHIKGSENKRPNGNFSHF